MSLYAIGIVRELDGSLAIRLLSPDDLRCQDIPVDDMSKYINRENGVRNLDYDKNGNIHWKQGSEDRYPIIDKMTNTIRNKDSVIVLGLADTGIEKYFRVSNYCGQIIDIKAPELIEYSKKYKLANCKLVKRNNVEFIAAIEGNIEEINTKPQFKFDTNLKYMMINMPFVTSDTLELPTYVEGRPIFDITGLKVTPMSSALAIKKLIVSKYLKKIQIGLFAPLPNLEEVDILGNDVLVYNSSFISLHNLRKVHFKKVSQMGIGCFRDLKKLEQVTADTPLKYIADSSFWGCPNFDITSILVEGVTCIGAKAFCGNTSTTEIELPSTVVEVYETAFANCTKLKKVRTKSDILQIAARGRGSKDGFLGGLDTVELYIPKHCAIGGQIGINVKIIREEASDANGMLVDRKTRKGNILGMQLNPMKIAESCAEIADIITQASQEEVTNMILDLVNRLIEPNNKNWNATGIYSLSGFKTKMSMYSAGAMKHATKVRNIGKYIVLTGKDIVFVPVDKNILSKYFKDRRTLFPSLIPEAAELKYLASVDVSNTGLIRLIYDDKQKHYTKYIDRFEIR